MSFRPRATSREPQYIAHSLFAGLKIELDDIGAKRKAINLDDGVDGDISDGIGLPPGWTVRRTFLGEYEYYSDYATTKSFPTKLNSGALKDAWSKYLKRFPVVEKPAEESGDGGDYGEFGDLPPGWKLTVNPSGDFEYVSEYATTRSFTKAPSKSGIAQAWKRYRNHIQKADLPPMTAFGPQVDMDACREGSGLFGSLSKTLHRMRVVEHMKSEWCRSSNPPSAAYIGAPDKTDSEFFQRTVDGGTLPTDTKFHAINKDAFYTGDGRLEFPNVSFYESTTMEDYLETSNDNDYTVIWLDFISKSVSYHTLWKACKSATTHVMLVLSLRTQSMLTVTRVVDAISSSIGVSLSHCENYSGASNVRNMAFFEIDCSNFRPQAYTPQYEHVGSLIYISEEAGDDTMFRLECGGVGMYMCFCIGYLPSTDSYRVVPYDSTRHIMAYTNHKLVASVDVLYTADLNARLESGMCR